jgi:hypothetical protein
MLPKPLWSSGNRKKRKNTVLAFYDKDTFEQSCLAGEGLKGVCIAKRILVRQRFNIYKLSKSSVFLSIIFTVCAALI